MDTEDVYFFVHVMKTAGWSFAFYMNEVLGADSVYPVRSAGVSFDDLVRKRIMLAELRALTPDERVGLRGYSGHFPPFASEIVGATRTVTILRDPVERSISMLKQRQRRHAPHMTLTQIYEDPEVFGPYVDNHQTKVFAMDPDDAPESFLDPIRLDRARLDAAKERLSRIDVVGLREQYGRFLEAVQETFGWPPPTRAWAANVGPVVDIPAGLRERIAEDLKWDRELYDFAVQLVAERRIGINRS